MIRQDNELLQTALALSSPIPWKAIRERAQKRKARLQIVRQNKLRYRAAIAKFNTQLEKEKEHIREFERKLYNESQNKKYKCNRCNNFNKEPNKLCLICALGMLTVGIASIALKQGKLCWLSR